MSINSRAKGAEGEREFRDVLRKYGYEAERGQQRAGGADSPDVIHNIPGVHFEVKRVEAFRIYLWLAQAKRDAGTDKDAIVAYRANRKEWLFSMDEATFFSYLPVRAI